MSLENNIGQSNSDKSLRLNDIEELVSQNQLDSAVHRLTKFADENPTEERAIRFFCSQIEDGLWSQYKREFGEYADDLQQGKKTQQPKRPDFRPIKNIIHKIRSPLEDADPNSAHVRRLKFFQELDKVYGLMDQNRHGEGLVCLSFLQDQYPQEEIILNQVKSIITSAKTNYDHPSARRKRFLEDVNNIYQLIERNFFQMAHNYLDAIEPVYPEFREKIRNSRQELFRVQKGQKDAADLQKGDLEWINRETNERIIFKFEEPQNTIPPLLSRMRNSIARLFSRTKRFWERGKRWRDHN